MSVIRARMCGPEEAVIGPSEECGAAQSPIDEIMTRRIACRDFCDAPVPRRTIDQILHVARFAPSGANIQPWHVYVLSGAAEANVSAALLNAHETCRDEHVSEHKYYASQLPDPYLKRRQEFGRLFYGSLGIRQADAEARSRQTAKNYTFLGLPWD
ncbi:nitroreductase family protein [Bradyrhizobium symbiodeficiens]|uniref:Nitroreductase family protein n=1 Tax=Bradyrhizobium symbiodeficiens TaxID=1404367 RepID=A0AAJ6MN37_9BRAD|nr:nitroreductase family protein [Bradyrhizobium symbiodeficiens]